ncbi:MAG: dihydroorotase, partial [Planctomycetota bacterium]
MNGDSERFRAGGDFVIAGGRVVDPANEIDGPGDLVIRGGKVDGLGAPDSTVSYDLPRFDASGLIVAPGFVDPHASFREPGDEADETVASGAEAALAGGFTTVACLPDTSPAVDNRAAAEFVTLQGARAGFARVLPLGAVTKGVAGEELAEIGQLVEGHAVAFTDGKRPIRNAEILRRALQYAGMFDRVVMTLPQVAELIDGRVMHEGRLSTRLGLPGMPAAAEHIAVDRDIALAELTGARLHLMCVSTSQAVASIAAAKGRGVRVTADVTPHHLALDDGSLASFDSRFKTMPPLRPAEHVDALRRGLAEGVIDAVCADHQPLAPQKKSGDLLGDPFGASGIEAAVSAVAAATLG